MSNTAQHLRKTVYAALCLATALVLPFITGQIPEIGKMLCPMHLPILFCGFICGWQWGLVTGFAAPFLRLALFGQPQMPTAIGMAFELAAYGVLFALFLGMFPKKHWSIYPALLCAMVGGRVVLCVVKFAIAGFTQTTFSFAAYFVANVTAALPGIALQFVLIPPLVILTRRLATTNQN